jgi:hypothetical protein
MGRIGAFDGDEHNFFDAFLLIRRHAGSTDLQTLATEVLGLSKMNWNSFDLYTQVPATIETSGQIARIGRLMEGYGEASYDYRGGSRTAQTDWRKRSVAGSSQHLMMGLWCDSSDHLT